ncbi:cupin domain-containing protein [Stieleria sp. TO1_6]|uniref:cupin domain-containing protein n=1 Tax=Stieleria tagensis TaxID=2956795 RepID=UPI00209B4E37|nr:cupin domain-containing protein [Stieleria tagensis]MCO8123846.1 cupin domain-containing protein [Stieleria tagensis]
MSIHHAKPGEVIDVRPLGEALSDTKTRALFKTDRIEVLRLVMPAGKTIAEHKAPGEITVQCLEGQIDFTTMGQTHALAAGDMLFLAAGEPHALQAHQDSSVLVTICLPN